MHQIKVSLQEPDNCNKTQAQRQLIKNMVDRINTLTFLLYEIERGTPLGKITSTLFNLHRQVKGRPGNDGYTTVSLPTLAGLTGINEEELLQALDFLQEQGVVHIIHSD